MPKSSDALAVVLVPADPARTLRRPVFAPEHRVDWLLFPRLDRLVARGRGGRYLSVPAYVHAPSSGDDPWPLRFHLKGEALPGPGPLHFEVLEGGWVRFERDGAPDLVLPLEGLTPGECAATWPDFVAHRPRAA